jgi:phosphate-selective porin
MNACYFPLNYFNADRYQSLQQAKRASYSLEDTRQKIVNAKNHSLRLSFIWFFFKNNLKNEYIFIKKKRKLTQL